MSYRISAIKYMESEIVDAQTMGNVRYGGNGSMNLHFNPHMSKWICAFKWGDGTKIECVNSSMTDVIWDAIFKVRVETGN